MKTKIIIKVDRSRHCVGCTDTTCEKTLYEFLQCCIEDEQYTKQTEPETFNDLLTLCGFTEGCCLFERNGDKYIEVRTEWQIFTFHRNGTILVSPDIYLMDNATPQQMWQIIKNLIGKE